MALSIVALHERLQNVLVLAPATLKLVWRDQIEEHDPQLTYTVVGAVYRKGKWRTASRQERQQQYMEDTRLKIVNYELLLRDIELRVVYWDMIIADEVTCLRAWQQHKKRKDGTKYTTTVGRDRQLRSRYRMGLSGAPLENRLEEYVPSSYTRANASAFETWTSTRSKIRYRS